MSAAARTLSLVDLCDLSEDAAHKMLCAMRWPDTDGAPVCPNCSCAAVYTYQCRRLFKCKACHRQFSATSGTSLAYRKLPVRTLLMAFSLFVNAAKGISSLQLSRYLGLHAKTAFVLLRKLRCALTSNFATTRLSGVVEIDGGWFGGHVRPENHRVARVDRRRRQHKSGKRRCVVVMRQRGGPTVTAVVKHEAEAVPIIRRRVARGSTVHADEARAWDDLHASFGGLWSCNSWSSSTGVEALEEQYWVFGFLTGIGAESAYRNPLVGTDADGVIAWINNYCAKNPTDAVIQAAVAFTQRRTPK